MEVCIGTVDGFVGNKGSGGSVLCRGFLRETVISRFIDEMNFYVMSV